MAYGYQHLVRALSRLANEHGVPNRFHASEAASLGGVSVAQAQFIGRQGAIAVRSDLQARYKRGWFIVEETGLAPRKPEERQQHRGEI